LTFTRIGVLRFSGDKAVSNSAALWRIYDRYLTGPNEHRNAYVITRLHARPAVMWNTKRAVTKVDELAGLKFRADAAFVEAVRARTVKFEQARLNDAKAKGMDAPKVLAPYRARL
jgi:hypothetical protein